MGSSRTDWILNLIDKVSAPLKRVQENANNTTKAGARLGDCLKRVRAIDYYALGQGLQTLNDQLQQAVQPGIKFESALADVEAITGITGEKLDALGDKARKSAMQFGGKASESLDTYKTLLSRLGPDIAKSPEALEKMEHNVRVLSKTMGGDARASVDALTTAMMQYGVDLSKPAEAQKTMANMMNVMAAGAKFGAAEVTGVSAALKVAGVQAKLSGVSFEETNSMVQALSGAYEGAEAGTKIRNVLAKMSGEDVLPKEVVDKLHALDVNMDIVSDTSLSLEDRLRELKKAQADGTLVAQMFNLENAAAASILLDSIDAQSKMTEQITGTNTANEQAAVVMDTYAEKMSRLNAWFDNFKISIFNATKPLLPFFDIMGKTLFTASQFGTVFSALNPIMERFNKKNEKTSNVLKKTRRQSLLTGLSFKSLGLSGIVASVGTWTLTGSIKALSQAIKSIPLLGWVLAIIGVLIALFSYLWKNSEKFRGFIYGTWNVIKVIFGKIWAVIGPVLDWIGEKFVGVFSGIWNTVTSVFGKVWGFLKAAFGFIKNIITSGLSIVNEIFSSIFGGVYDTVVGIFKSIWEKIKYYIDLILWPIKKAGKFFGKVLGVDTEELTDAFGKGMARGDAEIETDAEKRENERIAKDGKATPTPFNLASPEAVAEAGTGATAPIATGNTGTSPSGASNGGGSGKALSMTLNVVNNFNIKDGGDFMARKDEILNYIVGKLNDTMKDSLIMAG